MKKLIIVLALGFAFWHYYLQPPSSPVITNIAADGSRLSTPVIEQPAPAFSLQRVMPSFASSNNAQPTAGAQPAANYRCDGRRYCSQMHSCEEATYFLRNCPNVKMDGNNDGVPCEQQWCGR